MREGSIQEEEAGLGVLFGRRFDQLVDELDDYVNIFAPDGTIVYVNKRLCKDVGMGKSELVGRCFFDLIPEAVASPLRVAIAELTPDNPVYLHEQETFFGGDKKRIVQWLNRAIFGNDGSISHVQAVGRDMTELYLQRVERERLWSRLSHHEKMAAIGQLAGGVAHDFNNQLAGIVGNAELLRDAVGGNPRLVNYVDNVLTGAKRSADLTKQLLAFARKGKYVVEKLDVNQVVGEVINLLRHSFDKRIVIERQLSPAVFVDGDRSQLQNVVMNLAINARDAMPDGGRLLFETKRVRFDHDNNVAKVAPGPYVCVSVADTGVGIEPAIKEHIFDPFFTTKPVGKGTGMGLAAVYGTVTNHKGGISVSSDVGKGARFDIYLPLAHNEKAVKTGERTSNPANWVTSKGRIMVVDDEPLVLEVASLQLDRLGYDVDPFADGREAIEFYRENWKQIDLVILDMVMPQMNGRELFFALREINPNIRSILSTGYALDGAAQQLQDDGVDAFLQKPYRQRTLAAVVTRLLVDE